MAQVNPTGEVQRITHPGLLVIAAFALAIAVGTALLSLPVSHRPNTAPDVGDAFFTASSAVTVTGLVVVDTGATWSLFGELVVLALIQLGGLGIMTLAGFLGIAFNRRLGIRMGLLAGAEIGLTEIGVLRNLIGNIVRFVLISEAVVAIALTGRFLIEGDHGLWRSIHLGVFHAVSAFNNAGFSILATGLERYVGDWFVNLVIAAAFIVGGIGFPVVFELRRRWRLPRSWSLHTKVTLAMTLILLAGGTVVIALAEWTNKATLGGLDIDARLLAAFFQSATARTAGFNTVAVGELRSSTLLVMVLLMVIGAGSASTGGGIKASTVAVIIRSTLAELQRDPTTTLFHRRLSLAIQRQALALLVGALVVVGTATFLLAAAHQNIPVSDLLFEAASAFGTVGVSTGVTTELSWVGRVVVIVLMFIGRVGPVTFGTAVLLRPHQMHFQYAEEDVVVG